MLYKKSTFGSLEPFNILGNILKNSSKMLTFLLFWSLVNATVTSTCWHMTCPWYLPDVTNIIMLPSWFILSFWFPNWIPLQGISADSAKLSLWTVVNRHCEHGRLQVCVQVPSPNCPGVRAPGSSSDGIVFLIVSWSKPHSRKDSKKICLQFLDWEFQW